MTRPMGAALLPALSLALALGLLVARGAAAAPPSPADLRYPSDDSLAYDVVPLARGETLESRFGERWRDIARFNRIDRRHARPGTRLRVPRDSARAACFCPMPETYAAAALDARCILVDLDEQFLGAYERGRLVFCAPIAGGTAAHPTPDGDFRVTAVDRDHVSNLYTIEGTQRPYPMRWALCFLVDHEGVSYWIHGRDLPGYPASHGCIGLSDEVMQNACYGEPKDPQLEDARALYEWATRGAPAADGPHAVDGPRVVVVGAGPRRVGAHGAAGAAR